MKVSLSAVFLLGSCVCVSAQMTPSDATSAAPKPIVHGTINAPARWAKLKSQGLSHLDAVTPVASVLSYDTNKRLSKVMEPDALGKPTIETDIEYDAKGNVTKITQLGGKGDAPRRRTFTYDDADRLTSSVSPEAGELSYTYDAAGNIATRTDASGTTVTYSYDGKKRIVKKQYSDGTPDVHFTYTGTDHSIHSWVVVDGLRRYERRYHLDAHLGIDVVAQRFPERGVAGKDKVESYVYVARMRYDAKGHLKGIVYPDGRVVTQDFDAKGNVDTVADESATYFFGATYTATHLLAGAALGNGATLKKTYDAQQKLQGLAVQGAGKKLLDNSYEYNAFGSLTKVADGLEPGETLSYHYDPLSRILEATSEDDSLKQHFAYDAFGNRALSAETHKVPVFDEHNRPAGAAGITYNELGQVTSDGRHTYTFNAEGLITAVDGGAIRYFYDGDGNRVQKVVDGVTNDYVWLGEQLLAEKLADGTWVDYIYANGERIASVATPAKQPDGKAVVAKTTYFVTDTLGVTRMALSSAGRIAAEGVFTPFELEIREKSGSTAKDAAAASITYTGELHDAETGLASYKYRSYNPGLGRWMSPDPSSLHYSKLSDPQTFNLYAYVDNDPLKYRDELGLYPGDDDDGDGCTECLYGNGPNEGLLQDGGDGGGGVGGGGGNADPCANDPSCVTVVANPDPPVDTDPNPGADPCQFDACVTTDPDPSVPTDPAPNPGLLAPSCLVNLPSAPTGASVLTPQQEKAAETQAQKNLANYSQDGAQPHSGDNPSQMRLTPQCDGGNKDCVYTLSGMGTNPYTGNPWEYRIWEHQTQAVAGSASVGTMDNITPPSQGAGPITLKTH